MSTPAPPPPSMSKRPLQLSKKTPSLEQLRVILETCLYRGQGEEEVTDRGQLEALTLVELQVRMHPSATVGFGRFYAGDRGVGNA